MPLRGRLQERLLCRDDLRSVVRGAGGVKLQPAVHIAAGGHPVALASADFDRDGRPDVAATCVADQAVVLLLGSKGGLRRTLPCKTGEFPSAVVAGDWNGDGKPDLATANYSSGDVSVLLNQGPRAQRLRSASSPCARVL
ncbi:MAG: VCBS repeat-containing protein [Myxococcales bacterium]|nr:VCBS repeat-containing protein [Myxococcales bacterium]